MTENKGTGVNTLRFLIALCYVAFSTGLVQQQQQQQRHHHPARASARSSPEPPPVPESATAADGSSRRSFGIVSAASLSSLLIGAGGSSYSARADPYNALIPTGSGGILQQRATIQKADGWSNGNNGDLVTQLGISRIGTSADESSRSIGPLQQSLSPFASQEVYYPSSFAGEWTVRATLQQKVFPFGPDFVPSRSLVEGSPRNRQEQIGDSTSYVSRFIASGDKTAEKTIADRAFNLVSMSRSYQQLSPVIADSIQWDYKRDPTRLSFQTEPITADMRPIGPRKAEVYLTARKTEEAREAFASAERSRTVTVGTGSVSANDQEVITEFRTVDEDTIRAVSRVAIFLTPNPNSREGVLWQQVNGKAVAFYDYELVMERRKSQ